MVPSANKGAVDAGASGFPVFSCADLNGALKKDFKMLNCPPDSPEHDFFLSYLYPPCVIIINCVLYANCASW